MDWTQNNTICKTWTGLICKTWTGLICKTWTGLRTIQFVKPGLDSFVKHGLDSFVKHGLIFLLLMNTLIVSFIQFDLEEDFFLCHLVPEFSKLKVLCIVPPFGECDSVVSANLEKFKLFQF